MVRDLEQQNRLDQAVFEAQETTGDLLYELVSVQEDELPGGVGAGDAGVGAAGERGPDPTGTPPVAGDHPKLREIQVRRHRTAARPRLRRATSG